MAENTPRCVVVRNHEHCWGRATAPDLPFPLCYKHLGEIFAYLGDLSRRTDYAEFAGAEVGPLRVRQSVVYYVELDGLIKIGSTADMDQRLRHYPPSAQLLATEDGDVELERARHKEFNRSLRHRREWFDKAPELMAHIERLRRRALDGRPAPGHAGTAGIGT